MTHPAPPPDVARVINGYPDVVRPGVLGLRALIHTRAEALSIGPLTETLKWGQPSLTPANGLGTPLRLGPHKQATFALFAHCQTTVIASYATVFPGWDRIDGNRAVLFDHPDEIEPQRLSCLIDHALTYHGKDATISSISQ